MNGCLTLDLLLFILVTAVGHAVWAGPSGTTLKMACAPADHEVALALVGDDLWLTQNGGRSWRVVAPNVARAGHVYLEDEEINDLSMLGSEDETFSEAQEVDNGAAPSESFETVSVLNAMAVSDDGCFAYSVGDSLVMGCGHSTARGRLELRQVKQLQFDLRGDLFALTGTGLVVLRKSVSDIRPRMHTVRHFQHPVGMVLGAREALFVLDRLGVHRCPVAGNACETDPVVAVSGAAAIAMAGGHLLENDGKDDWSVLLLRDGTVYRWDGRRSVPVAAAPRHASAFWADGEGALRFFVEGIGWLKEAGGTFQRVSETAVTVDTLGRFWLGSVDGPRAPVTSEFPADRGGDVRTGKSPGELRGQGESSAVELRFVRRDRTVPTCHPVELSPLPTMGLFFRVRNGVAMQRGRIPADDRGRLRTEIAAGLTASWRWKRGKPHACRTRLSRAHREAANRREKATLLYQAFRALQRPEREKETLREAVAKRTARDRLRALIRVNGGVVVEKEVK